MSARISHKVFCLSVFFCLLFAGQTQAQYTYFNQISGEVDDQSSEQTANIEVVDDGYVIWGVGIDDGQLFHFMSKYDFEGNILDENELIFEDEYFFAGIVNSMQWNPYTEQFVVLQGSAIDEEVSARLLSFYPNLELDQNIIYDSYAPNTYFFGFLIQEDGYVIYGEHGPLVNGEGTFIMKLDFEGNVLWNEIMQPEVNEHVYRNWSIVPLETGYLISGGGNTGDPFGLITIVDEIGNTDSAIVVDDENELRTNAGSAVELLNGEILLGRSIAYADVEEIDNPNFFWNKIRLEKFDPETQEIYWQQDYHDDFEMILGGTRKIIATPDGGALILGGRYGWFFDFYAWMMKVDADGNEEWFREYTYETCDNCFNTLQDVELAQDGGYIAAGYFNNMEVDPRNNPWLLKVDACGDVEWEDCPPPTNGLGKEEAKSFSIYPNPTAGILMVEVPDIYEEVHATPRNAAGKPVFQESNLVGMATLNLRHLSSGNYILELESKDGTLHETHSIQIAK